MVKSLFLIIIASICFLSFTFGDSERVVIYGDSRLGHVTHQKIVDAIIRMKPAVVFHTGDLVTSSPEEWPIVNKIIYKLRKKAEFYPALGNHEYRTGIDSFLNNFELPNNEKWYSLERSGIHFIILNSNAAIGKGSKQYKWLESDLKDISDKTKFIIAIFHHPPFSSNKQDTKGLRIALVPLLEKYGVDIVFNGHAHAYERALRHNIYYITTGGGGAPLRDKTGRYIYAQKYIKAHHFCLLSVRHNQLDVKVFDSDSNLIDRFYIKSR